MNFKGSSKTEVSGGALKTIKEKTMSEEDEKLAAFFMDFRSALICYSGLKQIYRISGKPPKKKEFLKFFKYTLHDVNKEFNSNIKPIKLYNLLKDFDEAGIKASGASPIDRIVRILSDALIELLDEDDEQ